jgi:hypothetical protein
MYYSSQCQ